MQRSRFDGPRNAEPQMTDPDRPFQLRELFHGGYVWTGIAFALAGLLAENLTSGRPAFESLLLFGGFFLGIGVERNRQAIVRGS